MMIVKKILFIIDIVLFCKAVQEEDFDDLFLAILLFVIAFGIEKIK